MKNILLIIAILSCVGVVTFFYFKNGKSAVIPVQNKVESVEIKVESPLSGQKITSPLRVTGEARGSWFYEGIFAAVLQDGNRKSVGVGIMKAEGDWMTENFVKFSGEIPYSGQGTEKGTLLLRNDNPSGQPANQKEIRIPIIF